ncbi:MAG: ABC transporter permease, partial [Dongia sp.]
MQSIKSTALEPTAVELESMSLPQKIGRLLPVDGLPLCTLLLIVIFSIALPNTFPTMLNLRSILGDKAIIAILS